MSDQSSPAPSPAPPGPIRIFLDDKRDCPEGWVLARKPSEFLDLWEERGRDVCAISFDNNLGWGEATGSQIASLLWSEMREEPGTMPNLVHVGFHSDDTAIAHRMAEELKAAMAADPSFQRIDIHVGEPGKTAPARSAAAGAAMSAGMGI